MLETGLIKHGCLVLVIWIGSVLEGRRHSPIASVGSSTLDAEPMR